MRRALALSVITLVASSSAGFARAAPPAPAEGRGTTVIVIDTSASMKKEGRGDAARVAAGLYVQLVAPLGPVGIVSFAEDAKVVAEPRELSSAEDVGAAIRQLDRLAFDGKWTEYRAGLEAADKMLDGGAGCSRVVFLTDGDIDPDPADPFHQTDAIKAELAKAPKCGDAKGVRKPAYGSYPPHAPCEPVYKVIADQSVAVIQDKVLPSFKNKCVQLNAVALGVTGGPSYSLLKSWSAKTGGRVFAGDAAKDLPRLFSEAFAQSTASVVVPVKNAFEVEPRLKLIQIVAASSAPINVEVSTPAGKLDCDGKPSAECFNGEGLDARGSVVRVAAPQPGRWTVKVTGKGAATAQVLVVKRYDLTARATVAGKTASEFPYLDDTDVRKVKVEVLSGAGEPLPADAAFLRGVTASLHQPSRDIHQAMPATSPGVFEAEVKPPPAVVPPKRLLRDQEPARRESEPVVADVMFNGVPVARVQASLVPAVISLEPEKPVFEYKGVGKPIPIAAVAKFKDGTPVDAGRVAGAVAEVREGKDLIATLNCGSDARCTGEVVRKGRSRDTEVFDVSLVRNNVVLGAGKVSTKLNWGWMDYLLFFGVPALVAAGIIALLLGRYLPDRFPPGTEVVGYRLGEPEGSPEVKQTIERTHPLFKPSEAKANLARFTENRAHGYLTVRAADGRAMFDGVEKARPALEQDGCTISQIGAKEVEVAAGGTTYTIQIRFKS